MKEGRSKYALLILIVWVWVFLGIVATITLIAYVKGVSLDFKELINMLSKEPYLASYGEVVGIGALPLLISLIRKDNPEMYGLGRKGLLKSLALSLPPAVAISIARIMHGDLSIEGFSLRFPLNIWYAVLGVLAYGPLEVFFVVWLIVNTDIVLNSTKKVISPGLLITVLVFGLSHVLLSPQGGLLNAIKVTAIFMGLGLIFKYTRNSIGPMIAWTLINGQVSYLLVGCLT